MEIINKKAKFNYQIIETFEAGISLLGAEVKAIKRGKIDLSASFVKPIGNELYLINASISVGNVNFEYNSTRIRKLLLKRSEINYIVSKLKSARLTIVPVRVYNVGRLIKLEITLAKGKKAKDKKESLKRRVVDREIARSLKV